MDLDGLRPVRGRFDRLFEEHDTAIVRPDRLVFGHTAPGTSLDQLIEVLADRLALGHTERPELLAGETS